jgi:prepilin-type N-terminal cleavage/methylation domain-containing protein
MRRRSGFTIIELMVALAVSGIVLLGARAILETVADRAGGITRAAVAADRDANAERTLRALVERLEVGTGPGTEFGGDGASAAFISCWYATARASIYSSGHRSATRSSFAMGSKAVRSGI